MRSAALNIFDVKMSIAPSAILLALMSSVIQGNDLVIRRLVIPAAGENPAREHFTLHRYASDEQLGGPWDIDTIAVNIALTRGEEEGCAVWLQRGVHPSTFDRVSK